MTILRRHVFLLIGAWVALAATTICIAAPPEEDGPTRQELMQKLETLQAKMDRLEAQVEQSKSNARSTTDQAAVIDQVQTDAARRSQFMDLEGFTGGYIPNKGFVLRSDDGSYLLHPWLQFQFRNITNARQELGGNDDLENGFEVRRAKFGFDGNFATPDLNYLFQWTTDRHTGNPTLEDAWVKYKFTNSPFALRAGQIKDPLDHDQIMSSKYFLAVERSLVSDLFAAGDGYVQGASLIYDNSANIRVETAVTDGLRSQNTNFEDFPSTTSGNSPPADWGAARLCLTATN